MMMRALTSDGSQSNELNSPYRIHEIRATLEQKPHLRRFYEDTYQRYLRSIGVARTKAPGGIVIELGAGGSFFKSLFPEAVLTDIIPYPGLDRVLDATRMDLNDGTVTAFVMTNVLHHVPDAEEFFSEITRTLAPGGRVFIVDQHVSLLSRVLFTYAHHEPFLPHTCSWKFATSGPLSGANGALAWIIFHRDRLRFDSLFPKLKVLSYQPHTPLLYWFLGGLKSWSLFPCALYPLVRSFDRIVGRLFPWTCCFVDIELERL